VNPSLGTDIIEIERIRKVIQKYGKRFLDRLFTDKEQRYCEKFADPIPHYAARFAAKEAVIKVMGRAPLSWREIEILNTEEGKPEVYLSGASEGIFSKGFLIISMSHCRLYATATALFGLKNTV